MGDLVSRVTRPLTADDNRDDICPVCHDAIADATAVDPVLMLKRCAHAYHRSCLEVS